MSLKQNTNNNNSNLKSKKLVGGKLRQKGGADAADADAARVAADAARVAAEAALIGDNTIIPPLSVDVFTETILLPNISDTTPEEEIIKIIKNAHIISGKQEDGKIGTVREDIPDNNWQFRRILVDSMILYYTHASLQGKKAVISFNGKSLYDNYVQNRNEHKLLVYTNKNDHYKDILNKFYLPICEKIYQDFKKDKKIKIIGLTGGQGAGKSTITQIIKLILETKYNLRVIYFSIDDFYKKSVERIKMSKKVHQLFKTRGVPGTHDTSLIKKTFINLTKKNFRPLTIPLFDKSKDDRFPKKKWQKIKKQPHVIIFEGWCVGAKPQKKKYLKKSINILEKKYDPNLIWRSKVNYELQNEYAEIFNKISRLIFLKVPNFECVYNWRLLQEKKLQLTSKGKKIMSSTQVKKFIMYYERITKQMLTDLTKKAYAVLYLDKKHRFSKIKFN